MRTITIQIGKNIGVLKHAGKVRKCNLEPFCYLIKSVFLKREHVNKGYKLLNSYLLTVLVSIPFNKLPWAAEAEAPEAVAVAASERDGGKSTNN